MSEIWKPIPGYLNYKVSNLGRVKSIARLDTRGERRKGRILSQVANPQGHMLVTLYENGIRKTMTVHKAMAMAFIGEFHDELVVHHIDEDKTNNVIGNLQIMTVTDHLSLHHKGKSIDKKQVRKLYKPVHQYTKDGEFVATYESQHEAMRQTGVDNKRISQVCRGDKPSAGGYKWRYA